MLSFRLRIVVTLATICQACGDTTTALSTSKAVIHFSRVSANPHNVLSAVVLAGAAGSDSVAVAYGLEGGSLEHRTSAIAVSNDTASIPVLELRASSSYDMHVLAFRDGHVAAGPIMKFTTGPLPADLPTYQASGRYAAPGFVLFAADPYAIVVDNSGIVVWYRRFANGLGLNFQAHSPGRYLARPLTSDPVAILPWVELDALGNVTRTLPCARALQSRFHDLLLQSDGSYWIMCDETRPMDLSRDGGANNARVIGSVIQHINSAGTLLFEWTPFEHFDIRDLPLADRSGSLVNWTHANALTLDYEGHLLVSFRALNEITRIDSRTAQVLWRMGGARNDFTFLGTPTPRFARQHGLRITAANRLLILDNSGDAHQSRAELYDFDERSRTVEQLASYGSKPPVIAGLGGTVQDLGNGHTLVSFGNGSRVEEYDALGNVAWQLHQPGYVFRAQRVSSLYLLR